MSAVPVIDRLQAVSVSHVHDVHDPLGPIAYERVVARVRIELRPRHIPQMQLNWSALRDNAAFVCVGGGG